VTDVTVDAATIDENVSASSQHTCGAAIDAYVKAMVCEHRQVFLSSALRAMEDWIKVRPGLRNSTLAKVKMEA
jgi:hypothetical protein